MPTKPKTVSTVKPKIPKKVDLACGQNKTDGFHGIDIAGDADIIHDLMVTPWPLGSDTLEETTCSHFVEHIPHYRPEFNGIDGWWVFFNELYRVCKKDAVCKFMHPYAKHERAFWDPTHTRYIHEVSWYYLSKEWRESQKLDHYHAECDFEVTVIQGMGLDGSFTTRSEDHQQFSRTHYWNIVPDLYVELRVRK